MNRGRVEAEPWTSALSETTASSISIRGYDLLELIGAVPFASVVHLLYTGELPDEPAARLLDALMVASIDHGAGTPSVLAARTAVSGGASFQAGSAAGLLTMGQFHAAAVEDAMRSITEVADRASSGVPLDAAAADVVAEARAAGERLGGFGHRQHTSRDPRVDKLLGMARDAGVGGAYVDAAVAIENALEAQVGRRLPINIDGVYATILAEIDFPPELANAVFIASRMTGVMAHVVEELVSMPPMRRIDPVAHSYNGPAPRSLTSGGS